MPPYVGCDGMGRDDRKLIKRMKSNASGAPVNACRVSLTLNMYFASLKYTSPTFVTSVVNTIASMTFVIAIILR